MSETTRRSMLAGAAGLSAAMALAACSKEDGEDAGGGTDTNPAPPANNSTSKAPAGGAALANVADIPVGGGTVFKEQNVVVTQPTAGDIKAFTATCTHQQCLVAEVKGGTINCTCHGSKFKVADGSVATGPAAKALAPAKVTVANGKITLG